MVKDTNGNHYSLSTAKRQVGNGWGELIERAYDICQKENIRIAQIKEKFGELRFYVGSCSEEALNKISEIEEESTRICEDCGEVGETRFELPWSLTLCDKCLKIAVGNGH